MNAIYKTRVALIRIGKVMPFVVCALLFISYSESFVALETNNYLIWSNYTILNTPISSFIGDYVEYNLPMLLLLIVISIAIETCYWNKLACLYLAFNLAEKSYLDIELERAQIYAICIVNIIISGFLTYKGIKITLR